MPLPSWSLNTDVDYRLIYKFNVIEIKISTGFLKLDKLIPKSTQKNKFLTPGKFWGKMNIIKVLVATRQTEKYQQKRTENPLPTTNKVRMAS